MVLAPDGELYIATGTGGMEYHRRANQDRQGTPSAVTPAV
jgi:hypothetical protein